MTQSASVIIPVYNVAEHVDQLLDNLARFRAAPGIEVIIVDDGSTDETWSRLTRSVGERPGTTVLRHEVNQGVAAARRTGLHAANNDYVWLVDADDSWTPGGLERLLLAATENDADIVIGTARYCYPSGRRRDLFGPAPRLMTGEDALVELFHGTVTGHLWNKLIRRSLFEDALFPATRAHSDLALTAQVILNASTVQAISAHVYDYQISENSIITSGRPRWDSLHQVHEVIASAIRNKSPQILDSAAYQYFVGRYFVVSGLKDLDAGGYPRAVRRRRRRLLLRKVRLRGLIAMAARRDLTGMALIVTAKVLPWLLPVLTKHTRRK